MITLNMIATPNPPKENTMSYPFKDVEPKWQQTWRKQKSYLTPERANSTKPKSYVLEMFPYPSGKLHMGHVRNYAIGDAIARFMRLNGCDVLHPMGWDAFGLPAENAAIQMKVSPEIWTLENIEDMKKQFEFLGLSFDWDRELATCLPNYYGHEQKMFLDFYRKGIAYRKESWVNWDPIDHCVLANEQVINGLGWRSGAIVEKRKLRQWSLKITDYAQELLDDLDTLREGWPEKVLKMQENWIGRSQGALIDFEIEDYTSKLSVYTTRPETLFGAAFCAIAPVHPIAEELAKTNPEIAHFIEECQRTPTTEEAISTAEKKGIQTGLHIKHPFIEGRTLPLFIANFVLMDYGTGAIFACPAHDERDYDFAKKYNLPIIPVIHPTAGDYPSDAAYSGPGNVINSDFLSGLDVPTARARAIERLQEQGLGQGQTTFRLRDWCVSRQRYWGCPIPMIHCPTCGVVPVPDNELPVTLPKDVEFDLMGNPLDHHPTWKHVNCPKCGQAAERETDTLDTFFESSWYFLRFCDPKSPSPLNKEAVDQWMPVDWYIGGIEHAVLHLLYARFFTKALRDCGYHSISEPFKNLMTQGMVCHQSFKDTNGQWLFPHEVNKVNETTYVTLKDGSPVTMGRSEKMSKSKKNVVDPKEMVDTFGVDAVRLFVLSDNPPEKDFDWSEEGIEGCWRYLNKMWRILETAEPLKDRPGTDDVSLKFRRLTHQSINKITQAFEKNGFNKAIAFARELTRDIEDALTVGGISGSALYEAIQVLLVGMCPIIPHITSDMWGRFKATDAPDYIIDATWPVADAVLTAQDEITIVVQVNGKLRGNILVPLGTQESILIETALTLPAVQREIADKGIRRTIVVPNRIVNLVV